MDIAHILEELSYGMGELPREALEAAIAQKKQITPFLLAILEDAIQRIHEIVEDDNYEGHLYAMYLLAQFREPLAFPYIIRLFSFPGEIPHLIAGDMLTEDLSRILASVANKNIAPLKELIENPLINEYVRAACQMSLVIMVGCGFLSRTWVINYFKSLYEGKLERTHSFVWDSLVMCSCALHPEELVHHIRKAFDDLLIDTAFITINEVLAILAKEKQSHLFSLFQSTELIDDTVSEMEKWLTTAHHY